MNFSAFLTKTVTPHFYHKYSVIYFRCANDSYPLLFFSLLFRKLRLEHNIAVTMLDVSMGQWQEFQAMFETSFLGSHTFFWLKNYDDLDERTKKQVIQYVQQYKGPNTIGLCLSNDVQLVKHENLEVMLNQTLDQESFIGVLHFFNKSMTVPIKNVMNRVFNQSLVIPLDTACVLMHYMSVLGAATSEHFISDYLRKIITPEKSLFTLSTYFFSKKVKPFLTLWSTLTADYSDQFWVVYWSEQLWRAALFVEFSHAHQMQAAKKIAARLPFTFIQRDWQQFSPDELSAAHNALYQIDFELKNGGSSMALDLFYSKYFMGSFKKYRDENLTYPPFLS